MELLLGAGSARDKRISIAGRSAWRELITLDQNADHAPDVLHDLERLPYPFADDAFDEVHAYEVLEHCGRQGDWRFFFGQFAELWRILRPGGFLAATCPSFRSMWAWGDPSHTRVLCSGSLVFLNQEEYRKQVGKTAMSDFRFCYRADFALAPASLARSFENDESFQFVLQAIKPSRWKSVDSPGRVGVASAVDVAEELPTRRTG